MSMNSQNAGAMPATVMPPMQLVNSHLRLAAKVAMGYRGYGLPISEIISEGNVGLMHALNRYEPERGFRFATYAVWWIRASIQDYILRSWSLVKIGTTASQKKLFFKLRSAKNKIAAFESGDLRPDQVALIATNLDVSKEDVVEMNRRLAGDNQSMRRFAMMAKRVNGRTISLTNHPRRRPCSLNRTKAITSARL